MIDYIEFVFRWILGLQMAFWGLNGFFHWKQIPPSAKAINDFTQACLDTKFIMPTVKVFEIVFGILLLSGFFTLLALVALSPIVFVISGLHLCHNKNPWPVIGLITVPFLVLVILEHGKWRELFLS